MRSCTLWKSKSLARAEQLVLIRGDPGLLGRRGVEEKRKNEAGRSESRVRSSLSRVRFVVVSERRMDEIGQGQGVQFAGALVEKEIRPLPGERVENESVGRYSSWKSAIDSVSSVTTALENVPSP